jgi:hypothetical protein
MSPMLEVRDLVTRFYSDGATIHAVNGISYTLDAGESLGDCQREWLWQIGRRHVADGADSSYPPGRVEGGEVILQRAATCSRSSAEELRELCVAARLP